MYVCMDGWMSVTGLRLKYIHSLHTFLACDAHDAIVVEVKAKDLEDRRQCQSKSRCIKDG